MDIDSRGIIYFGDNLPILREMPDESIDLIYIDPPFNTGKTQSRRTIKTVRSQLGDRRGFQGNSYKTVELGTKVYQDSFNLDTDGIVPSEILNSYSILSSQASVFFLEGFLRPRLEEARRILKPHGSLYFHIDYREVHYCKILLDDIFGRDCFLNEIIWAYDYGAKAKTRWPTKHDNILFYVKNPSQYIFNSKSIDREPYMAPGLVGPEKAENGKLPTDTWWHTIVGTNSKERTGYPSQKPLGVINRIIQASSLKDQVVLDFFAGSGTVGESCLKLDRKFILIDNNYSAMEVMAKRFSFANEIAWINFDPTPYQIEKDQFEALEHDEIDPDFKLLESLAKPIRNTLEKHAENWISSPFSWVTQLPAAGKGKLGRSLLASWFTVKGVEVQWQKGTKSLMLINGYRFAVKFSTLWSEGCYKFQQIQADGYDYLICLGISPTKAHCWVIMREKVIERAVPQHRGAKGAEYWISIDPTSPPEWVRGSGGTLQDATNFVKGLR